jgi:dienelactone hydrolase
MADPTSFTSSGGTIPVQIVRPAGAAGTGAIIIAYGSDGLLDTASGPWKTMIEGYARDLAAKGFVALIPDYFARTNTIPPIDILSPAGLETIGNNRDKWQATLADAVAFAKGLHGVDASRIALLGFSLGGHLCLRLRAIPKVLVEYFAPELDGLGASGPLTLNVLIHHGERDQIDNPGPIETKLGASGAVVTRADYPNAGHGFGGANPGDLAAATTSKAATLAFIERHL